MQRFGKRFLLVAVTPCIVTCASAEISSLRLPEEIAGAASAVASEPWTTSRLRAGMRRALTDSYQLAVQRIRDRPQCARMFQNLGADGETVLADSRYYGVSLRTEQTICRRTSAFTQVGARATRICPSFAHLRPNQAAMVLIHEALHQAGMSEKPLDPKALDSSAINQMVSDRCGL